MNDKLKEQPERIDPNSVCRICLQISESKMVSLKQFKPMMEKFANIEVLESRLLSAKICEPCSQLLKASRILQANIAEANQEWKNINAKRYYLNVSSLHHMQERVKRSATQLYDPFTDDETKDYDEVVVQRVNVIEDVQNCGSCLTPFKHELRKKLKLKDLTDENLTDKVHYSDDDDMYSADDNYSHQLCFDCIENLEKTLIVVKNCRRVNLRGWQVSHCVLCRAESRHEGGKNAPKHIRDFAILWNEQTSAEKIALSSSYICKTCQLRLTDAMKFRYHILKIEEALRLEIEPASSKWVGYVGESAAELESKVYTIVEQTSALLESIDNKNDQFYEMGKVENVDAGSIVPAYDHEYDFEWNKIPISYDDSEESDTDIDSFQLNQPFYQKFIECDICHNEFHEAVYDVHRETHEWTGNKCHICDEKLKNNIILIKHILRRHKNHKGYLCELCGISFFGSQCFQAHVSRTHHIEEFFCNLCSKKFKLKKYLENHMRIHLNLQPWRCTFCDKRFNDKTDRKWHELTHTGNYKHFCEYCNKGFAKPRLVLIHQRVCKAKLNDPDLDSD